MKDKSSQILAEPFFSGRQGSQLIYNASGNDDISTNLVIGSKDPMGGNDGNVGDLQRALNKLGGKPKLSVDGKFGTNTKKSAKSLNYSYPITSTVFYKILSDANKGDASTSDTANLNEAQLKALWNKDKSKYGKLSSEPDYSKWLKRQKTLSGIKDFGSGIFQAGKDWLMEKQNGSSEDGGGGDDSDGGSDILGIPAPVFYIGSAVVAGLAIWGVVVLVKKSNKAKIAPQATLAAV